MDLEKKVTIMKSISDYIDTLTEEEKEKHKDLIDECLEREQELIIISNNRKESINRLENSLLFLYLV
jgi:predicted HAD superfamily phosphohydrolase YqeG